MEETVASLALAVHEKLELKKNRCPATTAESGSVLSQAFMAMSWRGSMWSTCSTAAFRSIRNF